jgi:iron complex outermembrane receptor protein
VGVVFGGFGFRQTIHSTVKQEQGAAAARFLLAPSALAATPGLLDGYGQSSDIRSTNVSAALFGQLKWSVTDRLRLLPGLRFNYDQKAVDYDTQIYGGLQTTDPALIALQRSILAPQAYQADVDDANASGQVTAAHQVVSRVNAFATYATSFKSVGLNLAGVPTNAAGQPALEAATVKPEDERHIEVGLKTEPLRGVTANFVHRRATTARGDWRAAGQGHLRFRSSWHLQMGTLPGRRVREPGTHLRPGRAALRCGRCQLSVLVLVECERLALSGG